MAALRNPMSRRVAAACRRISTPAAAGPLVSHWSSQERHSSSLVDVSGGFSEMLDATQRYYVVGGKGGVGKTSMAASLAVKFANHGEPTLIVSMDPTRSLSDSFEQDMGVGKAVCVDGFDSLFATEIGHVKIEDAGIASLINNVLGRMGLTHVDPSMLNGVLNRVPPGLEEALALSQLVKSIETQGADKFRRIVLDAPSTGYTLKLLSANNWFEKLVGMAIKFVNAASSMPNAASSMPTSKLSPEQVQVISSGLEELRQQTARVRELLFDSRSSEFIIVTIPTMMAVSESSRFHASLKKDGAHTRRLVVNQVLPASASDCRFCAAKRREQARAFGAIREDRDLGGLKLIQAPLLDVEVKGVPALRFLSDSVWK